MNKTLALILMSSTSLNALALGTEEFVQRLTSVHPFFQQLEADAQIATLNKQATTANQDWTLSLDTKYQDEDYGEVSSITTYSDLQSASVDVSAKKKLTTLGGDLTLKHNWKEKSKATTAELNTNRNKFSIDYSQPLLKNSGGINDRLNTDLAEIDVQISRINVLEKQENFVLGYLQKFVNLAYLQAQFDINQSRVELAQQELDLVEDKFAQSVVDKVDVLNQKDAYQRAKTQRLQARQALELLQRELALALKLDKTLIKAELDLYQIFEVATTNLERRLDQNARTLKINSLELDKLQRQLQSNKNKSLADLSLNLGLSSEGEHLDYDQSIDNQGTHYSVGLSLSYPLGGTESKTAVQKTQTQIRASDSARAEKLIELHTKTQLSLEKIQLLSEMLLLSKTQIQIASDRAQEEQKRYANGNSQASVVISAQDNEMSAKLSAAQVAKDYQQAVLEYKANIDTLIQ